MSHPHPGSTGRAAAPYAVAPEIARGPDRPASPLLNRPAPPTGATRSIGKFHPIPVIGHPEAFYLKHAKEAEAAGDRHARSAHKVGQYVTTGLTVGLQWDEKLRRFLHALDEYCVPPVSADDSLLAFYKKLGEIVRRHAGQEALAISRKRHDALVARLKAGEARETLEDEAEVFFFNLLGHHQCPDWCTKDAYHQIITWRDYWV